MVDIAKRIFCATRKEANLFTRNVLINEELAQGDVWRQAATRLRTGNTFKNRELSSDRAQLTVKASLDHDVILSSSDRALQGDNGIYAEISETTRARIRR